MPDITRLVAQLNHLLSALQLPFTLQSPTDLTPSLLLAILECMLGGRLDTGSPSPEPSEGQDATTKRKRRIQTVKVFLGVLETDVLKTDVGLSSIDPRRLADGGWDEVVFVGELLCSVGQSIGLLPIQSLSKGKGKAKDVRPIFTSPPESEPDIQWHDYFRTSSSSNTTLTKSNPTSSRIPTSTSMTSFEHREELSSPSSSITFLPPIMEPPDMEFSTHSLLLSRETTNAHPSSSFESSQISPSTSSSRTLNHMPSSPPPSRLLYTANADAHSPRFRSPNTSVRHTGRISLVDEDSELSSFFLSSLNVRSSTPKSIHTNAYASTHLGTNTVSTPHLSSPTTPSTRAQSSKNWMKFIQESPEHDPRRTLQLLNDRTRLMEELLRIRMGGLQPYDEV